VSNQSTSATVALAAPLLVACMSTSTPKNPPAAVALSAPPPSVPTVRQRPGWSPTLNRWGLAACRHAEEQGTGPHLLLGGDRVDPVDTAH
jgi:hypothetical protein